MTAPQTPVTSGPPVPEVTGRPPAERLATTPAAQMTPAELDADFAATFGPRNVHRPVKPPLSEDPARRRPRSVRPMPYGYYAGLVLRALRGMP